MIIGKSYKNRLKFSSKGGVGSKLVSNWPSKCCLKSYVKFVTEGTAWIWDIACQMNQKVHYFRPKHKKWPHHIHQNSASKKLMRPLFMLWCKIMHFLIHLTSINFFNMQVFSMILCCCLAINC